MPLMRGKSEKAFKHNIEAEMESGKPQKQSLAIAYAMKRKGKKMAGGGSTDHEMVDLDHDMVDRIMAKKFSKGGMVANDTDITADFQPNEFDDLVLRDELEFNYTGANSGDDLGNAQEDEDRADIVSRIMRSRAKKDRNPRPA